MAMRFVIGEDILPGTLNVVFRLVSTWTRYISRCVKNLHTGLVESFRVFGVPCFSKTVLVLRVGISALWTNCFVMFIGSWSWDLLLASFGIH